MSLRTLFAISLLGSLFCGFLSAQNPGNYTYQKGANSPAENSNIKEFTNPNPVLQLQVLRVGGGVDSLSSLKAWPDTSIPTAQIEKFELWHDKNGDGKVSAGDTNLGQWDANYYNVYYGVYFSSLSLNIDSTGAMLLITVNLKATATPYNVLSLAMWEGEDVDYGVYDLEFAGGSQATIIDGTGYGYFYGPYVVVAPNFSNISLGLGSNVPTGVVIPSSLNQPLLQFQLTLDNSGNIPTVTSVIVRRDTTSGHTALPADITAIRLYREVIANGAVDDVDVLLATGVQQGVNFDYKFTFTSLISTSNFLVVADIAAGAGINRVFRVSVQTYEIVTISTFVGGSSKVTEDAQTIKTTTSTGLAITVQPTNTPAGSYINNPTGVTVEARNGAAFDNTFTGIIFAQIASGPVGATFTSNSITAVRAVAGVATFTGLALSKSGAYTLQFVSAPLAPSAASTPFNISAGAAYRLVITAQPVDGFVGIAVPPPPTVEARDYYDNLVTSFTNRVTAALVSNPPGATLQNEQVFAVGGVATFSSLMINKASPGYSLMFTATGLASSGASAYFKMDVGAPAQLVMLQQPGNILGGASIAPLPRVQVQDAGGNIVTDYVGNISVAIGNNPGGATLTGTLSVAVASGVALFSDLSMDHAGVGYTLQFSIVEGATGFSAPFDVTVGPAVKLGLTAQPSDTTGGALFSPQPRVEVQDAGGNVIATDNTTKVTATITPGTGETGGELWGTAMLQVVAGVAAYTDLAVNKCGPTPYTLTFTSSGPHAGVISSSFVISLGALARVGVVTQPGLASFGSVFGQQPVAQLQDLGGNLISSSSANISVSIQSGSGTVGATLSGVANMFALNGQATFSNLSIDFAGVDYVLVFSSGILIDGLSQPFNVASPATHLAVTVQPGLSQIGYALTVQPTVEVRDGAETLVPDNFTLVTVEIAPSTGTPGAVLSGTTTLTAINGSVSFTNLQISSAGLGYRLKFTCYPLLTQAFSEAFDVAGAPVKLVVARQPVGNYAGEEFLIQPVVQVCDSADVVCVGENTINVNAYITPATGTEHAILTGTNPITVTAGVATFSDLGIDRPGQGYTLSFASSPSLFGVSTTQVDILGEMPPTNSSDTAITAGIDGGSCAGSEHAGAPGLLLAALALFGAAMRRRRKLS